MHYLPTEGGYWSHFKTLPPIVGTKSTFLCSSVCQPGFPTNAVEQWAAGVVLMSIVILATTFGHNSCPICINLLGQWEENKCLDKLQACWGLCLDKHHCMSLWVGGWVGGCVCACVCVRVCACVRMCVCA